MKKRKGQKTVKSTIWRVQIQGLNASKDFTNYKDFKEWVGTGINPKITSIVKIERKDTISDITLKYT